MPWNDDAFILTVGQTSYAVSFAELAVFAATFLLVAVGAFAVLVVSRAGSGGCRWRRAAEQTRPSFVKWRCDICGEEAFSIGRRPPKHCKRGLTSSL